VTSSADSKFKYWQSPAESTGSVFSLSPASIANVQPTIIYTNPTWTNKVVVTIENTYAWPTAWTVEVTTDGTAWTTIATNPVIPANGKVELYRQANNSWSSTVYRDNPLQIRGVRINVTQMNAAKVYFSLIELGARLESDLSPYVIDYDSKFELSDYSFVAPMGKASANTASVTLSNFDNRFSNTNPSSLYYGLIDKNVEMRMDVGISTDSYNTYPKTYEYIRQFTMLTDVWNGQELDTITVPLQDASQILQTVKPLARVFQNLTVAEIIWRMLDSIGFTSYYVEPVDADPATVIPYFWTDGTKTAWEIITDITESTQTAAYFDEYGVLQIKTRTTAYNLAKTPVWTLNRSLFNGNELANIVTLTHTNDFEANKVTVNWYQTDISKDTQGVIPMTQVWAPDGDVVLRSTQLTAAMTTGSTMIRIRPTDAKVWPYTGVLEVEGEFMRWTHKAYNYYDKNGTLQSKWIASNDEKVALDKLNPTKSFMNYFNGYLNIGLANRGLWSSVPKAHYIDVNGYVGRVKTGSGTGFVWNNGWRQVPDLGRARITTNGTFKGNTWYVVSRGAELDSPLAYYGTRMAITNGGVGGGMALNLGSYGNEAGYYIELYQTSNYARNPAARNTTNELSFYVRYANGTVKRLGPNGGKGVPLAVSTNAWYDIDVAATYSAGSPTFVIYVNGVAQMTVNVPLALAPPTGNTGRWGVFVRGNTNVDFEYLYGSSSNEVINFDNSTLYDRIKKGYVSTQLTKEWTYNTRSTYRIRNKRKQYFNQRYNQLFVDDFGAGVHEVREMDVKFEKPVLHSRLYMSNDSQAICPEYTGTAFGAKFMLANTHRSNAILNGTDAVTFGPNNPVEQRMFIYGRTINVADAPKKVEVKNDAAIRRRGEVELEIDSPWIQNEASAKALGDWINTHWAGGMDELTVECFANPLIQIGDVVGVEYSPSNMTTATHKYFVVGIDQKYSEGMETTLTLRRAKI
jgi:hypothetical protein